MKQSVLTRYRVMAYVTAVMLLVLSTCMVFKYGFGKGEDLTFVVSQAHGLLYMVYLVVAFDLGQKARWPFGKLLWILVAGSIPFAAFFVEPKVVAEVKPLIAGDGEDGEGEGAQGASGSLSKV
ncbi:DUF3817 domain-containing protein [Streptomyces sp. NPDC059853]|uniref:DUF3817 domain-containing protein n=1 Tax=Streptomyces sp. NPDC059853 TaxID=3346973 RepID=UPI0036649563